MDDTALLDCRLLWMIYVVSKLSSCFELAPRATAHTSVQSKRATAAGCTNLDEAVHPATVSWCIQDSNETPRLLLKNGLELSQLTRMLFAGLTRCP